LQEGKIARASFHPWWDDIVQEEIVFVEEGKLARAIFPPRWDDVIGDELMLV